MSETNGIDVTVKYRLGHSGTYRWVPCKMYCPNCGNGDRVWREDSDGDYYVGESHMCVACEHMWTIQGPSAIGPGADEASPQVLAQLKACESTI